MSQCLVAVMGSTGSGKSTLVKLLTEDTDIRIGSGLRSGKQVSFTVAFVKLNPFSETQDIKPYPLNVRGRTVFLVDTPGFDDTDRSDTEVFQALVDWLVATYRKGTKLSGILYLHRITDVRMQGSSYRNLRVFRDLCGEGCYQNVILLPTFWKTAAQEESVLQSRLDELTSEEEFWGKMIRCGAKVMPEPSSHADALNIICRFIDSEPRTLQIQKEMVDNQRSLQNTSAASTFLAVELERQRAENDRKLATQREEFQKILRLRERTHSENLDSLRQFHQQQLQSQRDADRELQQRIEETLRGTGVSDLSNELAPVSPTTGQPALQRSVTNSSEPWSIERRRERTQRYRAFYQYKMATLSHIERDRRVKCNFFRVKSCYQDVCRNCLRNIGGDECFRKSRSYLQVLYSSC